MSVPSTQEVSDRLDDLHDRCAARDDDSQRIVNYYFPGRGYVDPDEVGPEQDPFGICLVSAEGEVHGAGDWEVSFPLQSVSKVFAYAEALGTRGREEVLGHVGVKPSADSFASLAYDEVTNRPFNPMVNAGALATTNLLLGDDLDASFEGVLGLMRTCAAEPELRYDEETYEAELGGADRNRATAYLMRSEGMLTGDVERVLALYLRQCSVGVSCLELATMAATLANEGTNPRTGERALSTECCRDVLSVTYTCGMYDFAGEWAFEIGIPAKSGVSGAILAVVPGKGGIGVFSPGLDRYGNSVRGIRACRELSRRLGLHLFASEREDQMLRGRGPAAESAGVGPGATRH